MENKRKGFEIFDENISSYNVMRMGELLALSALKFICRHKMLHRMYANLARDIDYKTLDGYALTGQLRSRTGSRIVLMRIHR